MSGWPARAPFVPATPREVELGQAARAAYYKSIDGWAHEHQWQECPPHEQEAWIDTARGVLASLCRETPVIMQLPRDCTKCGAERATCPCRMALLEGAPGVIDMNAAAKSNDP